MVVAGSALQRLQHHLHHTRLLGGIHSTLYFDQNTAMPASAPVEQRHSLRLHPRELELMGALAQAQAEGYRGWQQAKARSHFNLFAPAPQQLGAASKT